MSPEIERLFEAAAALPQDRRAEYLASQTHDTTVQQEVLSLLSHDAFAEVCFEEALESAASSAAADLAMTPGTRIGDYAIVRLLGRGGMGAVYLATRADGSFEQTVAIKVIMPSDPAAFLRERFEQERQILARLNHPFIARLLDGGETASGLPYFVLEYVSGEHIDRYCARLRPNIRIRLELFLKVCAAVQFAHEHLIVHRDLKPGNILVGEDGIPKLLDFGIAKVLDPNDLAAGIGSTRILTIEYASPEQISGDPITTSSDIYSLGAVLYCLLSGDPPHVVDKLAPLEAMRAVTERQPPPVAGIPTGVAAILRKALHKDPARRYRSANELASDVHRFLDGKSVSAVEDSWSYQTGIFLRRHAGACSAVAAVLLIMAGGTATTLWQARRAEHRFAEVRQLSNKFLFDFEAEIHNVAGTTKARRLVVKTAQEYLDSLSRDASHDPALTRELADAYEKLGDLEGSTVEANTGDTKAALASYRRALALRDSLGDRQSGDVKIRTIFLNNVTDLARLEQQAGDVTRTIPLSLRAVDASREWLARDPGNVNLVNAAANALAVLARAESEKGDYASAVAHAKESLAVKQEAQKKHPDDMKLLHGVATGHFAVASFEKARGNPQEAVANYSAATDVLRAMAARNPEDVSLRRDVLAASWQLAASTLDVLQKEKKDLAPVLSLFEGVLASGRQLLRDDPANALVQTDVAGISLALGSALEQAGRPGDGLAILLPVIDSQKKRFNNAPENRTIGYSLALLNTWAAQCDRDLKRLQNALSHRRTAAGIFDYLVTASPGTYKYLHQKAENLHETGNLLAATGDYAGAGHCYDQGLEIAEKLPSGPSLLDASGLIADLRASSGRLPLKK